MKNLLIPFVLIVLCFGSCIEGKGKRKTKIVSSENSGISLIDTTKNFLFFSKDKNYKNDYAYDQIKSMENNLQSLDTINLNGNMYYIVEGDLLMTKQEYYQYKMQLNNLKQYDSLYYKVYKTNRQKIRGFRINGKIVKQPDHLNMKYAIVKSSFKGNLDHYKLVKESMAAAAKNWEGLCNVKFSYLAEWDDVLKGKNYPEELTFLIRKVSKNSEDIAFAFLPDLDLPKDRKHILVTPNYFTDTIYDKVGVFRHEIGHTLGFLHEHILSPRIGCKEAETRELDETPPYDTKSVMHYYCGGIGDKNLMFTDLDSAGVKFYYPNKTKLNYEY